MIIDLGDIESNRWFAALTDAERAEVLRNGCPKRGIPPLSISGNDPADFIGENYVYKGKRVEP